MGEGCAHGETRTEEEERETRRKKVEEETLSQPAIKANLSDARHRLQIRRAPYYFRILKNWFSSGCGGFHQRYESAYMTICSDIPVPCTQCLAEMLLDCLQIAGY